MNAFCYIRVSSKGQAEGDGPERQRQAIEAFSARHNLFRICEYQDAHTGTDEDRPAFTRMLQAVREQEIECIVIERMDRLARDLMVSEFLLRELRERGLKLFVADQGELIDMASNEQDPTRVLIRHILGAVAQWEKSVLVRKLKAARERAKENGRPCGNKAFGKFEAEMQTLNRLLDLGRNGVSFDNIAVTLNGEGLKTRSGRPWCPETVRQIYRRSDPAVPRKSSPPVNGELAVLLAQNDCGGAHAA